MRQMPAKRRVPAGRLSGALALTSLLAIVVACSSSGGKSSSKERDKIRSEREAKVGSFDADLVFLEKYAAPVILGDAGKQQLVVVPEWQGRVMTSTTGIPGEPGFGWINYELIESEKFVPHINVFGGEDRFWLGPEAGQYAVFFKAGDPFDLEHWQTPPLIDTEPFDVVGKTDDYVRLRREGELTNYAGTTFRFTIDRTIQLLDKDELKEDFEDLSFKGAKHVAYESRNRLKNTGDFAWTRDTGLLSIWILGMFKPSPSTVVILPFEPGPEDERGEFVNDRYFGKVPDDRLVVREDEGVLYFRGDGLHRSKIGIGPRRAKPVMGAYDPERKVLTIVRFEMPEDPASHDYVNSMWEMQDDPFAGDVANSYNDGPPEPGAPSLGPFYELESSSPAAALEPGKSLRHVHRTVHFQGRKKALSRIAEAALGVSLDGIDEIFGAGGAAGDGDGEESND